LVHVTVSPARTDLRSGANRNTARVAVFGMSWPVPAVTDGVRAVWAATNPRAASTRPWPISVARWTWASALTRAWLLGYGVPGGGQCASAFFSVGMRHTYGKSPGVSKPSVYV